MPDPLGSATRGPLGTDVASAPQRACASAQARSRPAKSRQFGHAVGLRGRKSSATRSVGHARCAGMRQFGDVPDQRTRQSSRAGHVQRKPRAAAPAEARSGAATRDGDAGTASCRKCVPRKVCVGCQLRKIAPSDKSALTPSAPLLTVPLATNGRTPIVSDSSLKGGA